MNRFLQLHHFMITTTIGIRKNSYAPVHGDPLERYHKSKQRARIFDQFCKYCFILVRNIEIQNDNEKLLKKLTEISDGKQVI